MNLLFVCTANISRSFLAEKLFQHRIQQHQINNVFAASAGIINMPGRTADEKMVEYLNQLGVDSVEHVPQKLEKNQVEWADLILVMEHGHVEHIKDQWPDAMDKVELLGQYTNDTGIEEEVLDPFGRTPFHYRVAQSQIAVAVDGLIKRRILRKSPDAEN